jgi:hypothetical protein
MEILKVLMDLLTVVLLALLLLILIRPPWFGKPPEHR